MADEYELVWSDTIGEEEILLDHMSFGAGNYSYSSHRLELERVPRINSATDMHFYKMLDAYTKLDTM